MPIQGDGAEARRATDGEPGGAAAAFEAATRLADHGELSDAERAYQQADEAGHPAAAACLGLLCERRGDLSGAAAAYQRADERGDGYGAFRLGLLLSGAGDWDGAKAAWARAEERGNDPAAVRLRDQLFGRAAEAEEARPVASERSALASPVLVGAVTVLVALVAVFLSYNANAGLPFVPTKELRVDIADASNLVVGNDVREGGFRVGLVSSMKPIELNNGQVGAQLTLKLDQRYGRVPIDSTASVQPLSLLGLKYVDLRVGRAAKLFPDGGTLPIGQTNVPVQFDDIFKTFDRPTRSAIRQNLSGFGDALTARGSALNDTFHSLPSLLGLSGAGRALPLRSAHRAHAPRALAELVHGCGRAGRAYQRRAVP